MVVVVVVFATLADIACGCDHIAVHLDQVEERWWIDPDCLIQWWQGRIDPHKDIWRGVERPVRCRSYQAYYVERHSQATVHLESTSLGTVTPEPLTRRHNSVETHFEGTKPCRRMMRLHLWRRRCLDRSGASRSDP